MSRLASKEKKGYVPLPPRTLELVEQRIAPASFDGLIRVLDPCAGKGWALYDITRRLRSMRSENNASPLVIPFAVEPDFSRWDQCRDRFGRDQAFSASWEEMTVANHSFSLIYLNPPYDYEAVKREEDGDDTSARKNRVEYNFLRETMQKLQPDGLLIFVLQHKILGTERVARTIAANFYDIHVYSLPDGEYEEYEQCVLFAYRRENIVDDNAGAKELMQWKTTRPPRLDDYEADNNDGKPYVYLVPAASLPQTKMVFRRTQLTYQETAELVYKEGASFTTDWQRLREPPPVNFRPVIRLRTGHIGPLISSGQLKTVNLGDMLVRGSASKEIVAQDEYGQLVDKDSPRCKTWTERFTTKIHCITSTGRYKVLSRPDELRDLLERYGSLLHEIVQDRYPPLYTGPTAQEWKLLGTLMPKKTLPGRKEAGLLTAQKHVVAATCRVLRERHAGIIVGEMGTGKGPMQLAVAELLNAYPVAIATPAHMVEKFAREARDTIPGAKPVIINTVADLMALRKRYKPGDKLIVISSYESWKEGPGRRAQAMRGTKLVEHKDPVTKQVVKTEAKRIYRCPKCGGEAPATIFGKRAKTRKCERQLEIREPNGKIVLRTCGEKLWQYGPLKKWPLARYVHEHMRGFFKLAIFDEVHKTKAKGSNIAYAFKMMINSVDYVLGGTGTLFGGKSTDLFFLLHRINHEVRKRFGFNQEGAWSATYGRQQMIFADEGEDESFTTGKRRRIARVKELPGISPAIYRWVFEQVVFLKVSELGFQMPPYAEEIERLVMDEVQKDQYEWLYNTLYERIREGASSFSRQGMKEAMSLMSVFLQNCLSRPMSGFRTERVFWKDPSVGHQVAYRVKRGVSEHYGYTDTDDARTIWNMTDIDVDDANPANPADQRGLFPDMLAARKAEQEQEQEIGDGLTEAQRMRTEPMDLYPVTHFGELLPKEKWLIAKMKAIAEEGGTALLYVRQTKKRNIQPRLLEILTKAGFRAVILPDGDARLREAWIQRNASTAQVLITNAKKVETGLDLVMFNHVIFYELDYSLFTMWQAMRRVWRLGQTKAVTVTIPIHMDAMEAHALSIMANKFQAALLLYGEMGAGLAQEADVQDVMAELAQHILGGQQLSANGIDSLMAASIENELEGAEASEAILTPEQLAELFAQLAENEEEEDGEAEQDGDDFVDDGYDIEGTGMTTLIDGTALQDLPIFAAIQDLFTQPPTELIDPLPPAMPTFQPGALPEPAPLPEPLPTPLPAPQTKPSVADDLLTIMLATLPASLTPIVTDFKQGQHVQIRDGRQGIILAISNEGYADIVVDNARYCLLVPLDDLTIVDASAAPAPAAPAQTLTTPLVTKESDTRTPTIYDFWDFQKDHTEGVTSISVSPKKEKKAKGAPHGIRQMDMAAFLNAEPDFNQSQAKPS